MQNSPNPDVNSTENEGGQFDIERENDSQSDVENIPLPPDEPKPAPVEEPPADNDKGGVDEPNRAPKEIV